MAEEENIAAALGRSIEDASFLGNTSGKVTRRGLLTGIFWILGMTALAWGIEFADWILDLLKADLDNLGIHPRRLGGLLGVFFSPWLHGSWGHLLGNTIAFWGLGFFMVLAERNRFLRTTFWLTLLSGLGTWLIGRGASVHIGASGLIYGYFGYLLARALTERRIVWMIAGLTILILYGGFFWGVFPSDHRISWEAHLCGCLAGIFLGRRHGKRSREERVKASQEQSL